MVFNLGPCSILFDLMRLRNLQKSSLLYVGLGSNAKALQEIFSTLPIYSAFSEVGDTFKARQYEVCLVASDRDISIPRRERRERSLSLFLCLSCGLFLLLSGPDLETCLCAASENPLNKPEFVGFRNPGGLKLKRSC